METEDVVETNEAVVAPVRLIFLSTWTAQRIIPHYKYGASQVVLLSEKRLDSEHRQVAIKRNSKDNRKTRYVASGITLSTESEEYIITVVFCASSEGGESEVRVSGLLNVSSSYSVARSTISNVSFRSNGTEVRNI